MVSSDLRHFHSAVSVITSASDTLEAVAQRDVMGGPPQGPTLHPRDSTSKRTGTVDINLFRMLFKVVIPFRNRPSTAVLRPASA